MTDRAQALATDTVAARGEFTDALAAIDAAIQRAPGLVGQWSARELIAHLGYWAGHAAELIHSVQDGRAHEAGVDEPSVEALNETVARVARGSEHAAVVEREAASVGALLERLENLDPALLDVRLPDGSSLEDGIREDGPDHYREHARDLRSRATAR